MGYTVVPLVRLGLLYTVIAFSIILLSIAGHIGSEYQNYSIIVNFSTLAIAVAVLTLVSVPVLLILGLFKKQAAFANIFIVELACLTLLWILWMASSGLAMSGVTLMDAACSELATLQQQTGFGGLDHVGEQTGLGGAVEQAAIGAFFSCSEPQALAALSWTTWIILLVYINSMLFLAIIQHRRGNRNVWTKSVHEVNFFAPPPGGITGPGVSCPQPTGQQLSPQQVPEYSAGTPPVQKEAPMNTGYAQPPADPEKAEMSQTAGIQPTELFRAYRTAG